MLSIFSIRKKIIDALRLYNKATRVKTLQTLEEIEANTESHCLAGAGAVAELNNKLAQGRVELVVNNDNSLGYKLDGADAVHPFTKMLTGTFHINSAGSYFSINGLKAYKKLSVSANSFTQVGVTNLEIYGDGTMLGNINTVTNRTYDISKCSSIKLLGKTTGSDAYRSFVTGSYTID